MDQELRDMIEENNELLRETRELALDNHKRIKKIHGNMRRSFWARILYWAVIIFISIGAYYAIAPTVNRLIDQYNTLTNQVNQATGYITNPGQAIGDGLNNVGIENLISTEDLSGINLDFLGDLIGDTTSE